MARLRRSLFHGYGKLTVAGIAPAHAAGFIVSQLCGAVVGLLVARFLLSTSARRCVKRSWVATILAVSCAVFERIEPTLNN
jgi:hypothetical protein